MDSLVGVLKLNDMLGLRLACDTGRTNPVAIGVGVVIASVGVSGIATAVLSPLVKGKVFDVFRARFFRLRGFRDPGAVGESLSSVEFDPGFLGISKDAGVSGDVPGVSALGDARGKDMPVIGEVSAEFESVVPVEKLPR